MKKHLIVDSVIKTIKAGIKPDIDNLNCGGCGWFALYLHYELKKLGIQSTIHFCRSNGRYINEMVYIDKEDFENMRLIFTHLTIKIYGDYYDSNGLLKGYRICDKPIPLKTLGQTFRIPDFYNRTYNKALNKELKSSIRVALKRATRIDAALINLARTIAP